MYLYSRLRTTLKTYLSLALLFLMSLSISQTGRSQEQIIKNGAEDWVIASMCSLDSRNVDLSLEPSFTFTRADGNNPRHLDALQAGLSTSDMSNLELAWAIAFPETSSMRAAPVIIGTTLFYSATDSGRVFALDTDNGCAKWVYTANTRLRSSIAYDVIDGVGTLVFGDQDGVRSAPRGHGDGRRRHGRSRLLGR